MSKSTIIELAERGLSTLNLQDETKPAGDYHVVLKEPIVLEKGDEVSVKSVFVDTISKSSARQITVKPTSADGKTCTIKASFGYYVKDWGSSDEANIPSKTFTLYNGLAAHETPSGETYLLNRPIDAPTDNSQELISLTFTYVGAHQGETLLNLKFMRQDGTYGPKHLLQFHPQNPKFKNYINFNADGSGPIILNATTFPAMRRDGVVDYQRGVNGFNFPFPTKKGVPTADLVKMEIFGGVFSPGFKNNFDIGVQDYPAGQSLSEYYQQEISFDVEAKSYAASDFAELITTKFSNTNISGIVPTEEYVLTDNPLIKTVRQLQNDPDFSEGNPQFFSLEGSRAAGGASSFEFTTAKTPADPDTTLNYVLGSSQFAVLYNNEYDKFEIGQIHNSLYSSVVADTTAQPEIRVIIPGGGGTKRYINKNTGIFLTGLEPEELWIGPESNLKFNPNILITPTHIKATGDVTFDVVDNLEDKVNITGDELGLDNLLQKTFESATQTFDVAIPFATAAGVNSIVSKTNLTLPIMAAHTLSPTNNIDQEKKSGGYFKIEVNMPGINSDIREGDNKNTNIQSIISRFYNQDSYTSGYNEGSIPFVYTSTNPTYLTDFRVRILEPDGKLSKDIGNTNAVFVEVIKSVN